MTRHSARPLDAHRRAWSTGVTASAVLLASLHAQQQGTFRSTVDLIAVDVQVVDQSGTPITSLGSDRFEVSINGAKRRVVSAELIGAGAVAAGPLDRPLLSGPIAMNLWPASGPGRTLVLAIDSSSFEADIWQRTQRSARAFLSQLDANDRIGLLAYPFGPVLDLTSDRARVIRALGATVGASQSLRTTFHLSPAEIIDISAETARSTSPGTAVRRTRAGALEGGSDAPTIQRVQDRECPNDPNCAARILMDADNSANLLEARAAQGVAGLRSLLTVLAGLEGRKTVVLLSGGMAVSDIPGGRPVIDDLARTLGEQLAQANAAIYTLHFDSNLRSTVSATRQRIDLGAADSVRETTLMGRWLEQFSASSGGALLRVQTDDGESAFQRVLRESSAYYLLGVEPAASDRNGKLRELKVKVQQRGATVRHRNWVIVPKRGGMSIFTIRASVVLAALLTASMGVRAAIGQRGQTPPTGRGAATGAPASAPSKDWKMADLLPSVADLGNGHDFERGRQLFHKASCGTCHAFASESEGAGLAPDLTPVASKYTRDFILQSILEPSATINGQFFHTKFTLKNGTVVTGSIIDVVDKKIIVAPVMLAPQATVELAEADVKSEEPSPVSPMPAGLLNQFTREEIVELFAFLDAGGDRGAAVYKKK